MPLLGKFIAYLFSLGFGLVATVVGTQWAIRVTAAATLGLIYLSCVVYYTQMIQPWLEGIFATSYGMLLGLLFPPVSGSVIGGMTGYYTCVVGKRYTAKLMKMAVG